MFCVLPSSVSIEKIRLKSVKLELIREKFASHPVAILYIHGGGFLIGINAVYRRFVSQIALKLQAQCFLVNYDILPKGHFPRSLNQCIDAYKALRQEGFLANQIFLMGDSSGGNLALSMLISLRDEGFPLPKGVVLMSPFLDLTLSGNSLKTKDEMDPIIPTKNMHSLVEAYCDGVHLNHPLTSPLFANLKGLPPFLIQVGTEEVLWDDSLRFVKRARKAGINVKFHVGKGVWHVYPILFPEIRESKKALEDIYKFVHFLKNSCERQM